MEYQSKVSPRWQRVRDDDRRHVALRSTDVPYQQNFELRIRAVQDVDLGLYRCVDVTGKNSASVYLSVDDATPAPAKDPRNFQQCCRELGIHVNCIPACSYDWWLSPSELPRDVLEGCLSGDDNFNLVKLVTCAADGKNHEPCCARKGVPDSCLPFCRGAIPVEHHRFRHCLVYYEKMATCMKEGNSVLPGPPTQLIASRCRQHGAPALGRASPRLQLGQSDLLSGALPHGGRCRVHATTEEHHVAELERLRLKPSTQFRVHGASRQRGRPQPAIRRHPGSNRHGHHTREAAPQPRRRAKESAGSVTFENPGYDKNADESAENGGHGNGNADGWFRPELTTGTTDDEAVIVENSYPVDRRNQSPARKTITCTNRWTPPRNKMATNLQRTFVQHPINPSARMQKPNRRQVCEMLLASVVFFLCTRMPVAQVTGEPTDAATETVSNRPDVLACCAANGVSAYCQPKICSLDLEYDDFDRNTTACLTQHFDVLITCFADGRDHSSCCRSRGVAHECVKYCDLSLLVPKEECIVDASKIKLCFEENYEILPGPPINIAASNITGFSAMISWDKPAKLGDSVTSYSISYKDILYSPSFRNTAEPFVTVHNVSSPHALAGLAGDSLHKVYMIARNAHGSSLPSDILQFRTQELQPYGNNTIPLTSLLPAEPSGEIPLFPDDTGDDGPLLVAAPLHNVTACCVAENISSQCLHLCTYDTLVADVMADFEMCRKNISSLLRCWVDNRNHRPCCERRGLSPVCARMCAGTRPRRGFSVRRCGNVSEEVLQCFKEGLNTLPKQPTNVQLQRINTTWLELAWTAPIDSPGNITQYNVYLYHANSISSLIDLHTNNSFVLTAVPPNITSCTLTGLQPGQKYFLQVQSVNGYGTSMPTYVLEAWTLQLTRDPNRDLLPQRLHVTKAGVAYLTISWRPPKKDTPDYIVINYRNITVKSPLNGSIDANSTDDDDDVPTGGDVISVGSWRQMNVSAGKTDATIEGLVADTKYEIYTSSVIAGKVIDGKQAHIFPRTLVKVSPFAAIIVQPANGERIWTIAGMAKTIRVPEYTSVLFKCHSHGTPDQRLAAIRQCVSFQLIGTPITVKIGRSSIRHRKREMCCR
ncbi:PREDICTED: Ig-like and fibronectin type-III domain-containing protein 2 [Priapulus caudatus]|uniref:Ig-like and fibronectin type-III domain-containing protein 2 n=1 Tax=Priapulus caudatus TaxID=37621 RepID=A0ABM1DSM8_PRICU|nr:PREDICTED: Ig-like and fibronectin type-III domain-containing protein 2 [Priapulus caudatus]